MAHARRGRGVSEGARMTSDTPIPDYDTLAAGPNWVLIADDGALYPDWPVLQVIADARDCALIINKGEADVVHLAVVSPRNWSLTRLITVLASAAAAVAGCTGLELFNSMLITGLTARRAREVLPLGHITPPGVA
jgi:hypothetical protein